ncbi:hypothetical protein HYS42_01635 [Candidatus Saccharibacteria bacterium]|nr:hypothetical protein [Candidatus Saccharibacteria bacterium]
MTEVLTEKSFNPIDEIARLSCLCASYANQLAAAETNGSDSVQGLRCSMEKAGQEALELWERFGISEADFFEATFQPEGWRERITYGKEREK